MGRQIKIISNEIEVIAGIDDSETANSIWEALPIESSVSTWGEEIYFTIPVQVEESDDARQDMDIGELGYWPPGSALCVFF
ncbi:MAG: cyclophilin-like fold protein, partial [Anaerolineales bacterium]